ncbi:hypothetical protein Achl_4027 (plasmid) [Pseudarthrobacter chlorophenolicus A6]|uniref:Uncharacterized protein n=1 Tax=Pseudarthrobacter chlorophenolicus (strain ATCC 700700 / DSM 12829 / CIP 107037 / JCM 12360 / KCTC 9906 / NCIMB 13794 / A6) TaxID=452863 RepID=B8HHT1_PSECP|nr:hypothetical protein [Pseudarthrobacter chlorophenolicus]ACL41978.1 hypothetical protein Achl_4027 [Pseudarthrobacter chlorophenolicus A6]SDQ19772.1 hypothetical protein SAMN04489738_0678 [Pseudarthrobacter chlorophenolicus]
MLFLTFSLPMAIVALVLGISGIRKRKGRIPAIITVALTVSAMIFLVWGFVTTQML